MVVQIDIAVEDSLWEALDLVPICRSAIDAICRVLGKAIEGELSIAFVDDKSIRQLNHQYRNTDKATNVLSFAMNGPMLGDIVLARETIFEQAREQNKSVQNHLIHLIVHGFLHLLGYDHIEDVKASEMEALEVRALAEMGIDNPYQLDESVCYKRSKD